MQMKLIQYRWAEAARFAKILIIDATSLYFSELLASFLQRNRTNMACICLLIIIYVYNIYACITSIYLKYLIK